MSRGSSYSGYVQLPADGGGVATDVGVGADGTAWMVSAGVYTVAPNDFAIKRWTGFGWGIVAGGGVRIAVDPHGAPWMVTSSRQIFRREGAAWVEHKLPGGAFDVGVGADGSVWAIGATPRGPHDFAVNRWLGASWETIDGGAVRIAVDPTGAPWIVNSSHQIFHREVNTWVRFPGEATDVGVGPDGKVWIITATPSGPNDFGVCYWNGARWTNVDVVAGVAISVGPGNVPWIVDSAHSVHVRSQNGSLPPGVDATAELGPTDANLPWSNWEGALKAVPQQRYRPTRIDQLVTIVKAAQRQNVPVRAVGSSWSYSDITIPTATWPATKPSGYLVETTGLNAVLDAPSKWGASSKELLVHVEAGIRLNDLNAQLDADQQALPTMGGSAGQSLAGAISTGTHGGDFLKGPLSEWVRAIQLVGPDGKVYWIEKASRPITDLGTVLTRFPYLDEAHVKYDDQWFNSVVVSMGSMGIIYSMVIAVVPTYYLQQRVLTYKWSSVRQALGDRSLFNEINYQLPGLCFVEVALTPNFAESDKNPIFAPSATWGDRSCLVTQRAVVAKPATPSDPGGGGCDLFRWLEENMPQYQGQPDFSEELLAFALFIYGLPNFLGLPGVSSSLSSALNVLAAQHPTLSATMYGVLDICRTSGQYWLLPELEKFLLDKVGVRADGIGKSFEIMAGSTASLRIEYADPPLQTYANPPRQRTTSVEVFFDVGSQSSTAPNYLQAIDALLDIIQRNGVFIGYVSLRFTQGTTAYLGMQQQFAAQPSLDSLNCSVEIAVFTGMPHNDDLMTAIEQFALNPLNGARLHWAQRSELLTAEAVHRMYPNLPAWRAVRAQLTNNGAITTFDNAFTARCGLSGP